MPTVEHGRTIEQRVTEQFNPIPYGSTEYIVVKKPGSMVKAERTLTRKERRYWKDVMIGRKQAEVEEPISEAHKIINEVPPTPNYLQDRMRVVGKLTQSASELGRVELTEATLPPSAINRLTQRWQNLIRLNGGFELISDKYGMVAELMLQSNGKR